MTTLTVTSPAFNQGQRIPAKFTCEAQDVSPELKWSAVPAGTKSIAVLVDDPDAPVGNWSHWVLWNVPAEATGLFAFTSGQSAYDARVDVSPR